MAEKVLIYAGTTEGRLLAQELSRAHIACDVHVATEYGQMVMPELAGVKVCVGRLDVEEMRALLKKNGQNNYAAVVDATHPFAIEVSANIRESTKGSGIPYLRLQRRMDDGICSIPENEGMKERAGTVHVFADYESCVQALTDTSGNILLTTGSKELAVFAPLKERLFVRVLPGLESIGLCEKAGIRGKQILAMQGPFSEEMNLAMIHQFSIRYLVTKASGAHSGFQEKLAAAQKAGITACVIGKQEQEQEQADDSGLVLEEVLDDRTPVAVVGAGGGFGLFLTEPGGGEQLVLGQVGPSGGAVLLQLVQVVFQNSCLVIFHVEQHYRPPSFLPKLMRGSMSTMSTSPKIRPMMPTQAYSSTMPCTMVLSWRCTQVTSRPPMPGMLYRLSM